MFTRHGDLDLSLVLNLAKTKPIFKITGFELSFAPRRGGAGLSQFKLCVCPGERGHWVLRSEVGAWVLRSEVGAWVLSSEVGATLIFKPLAAQVSYTFYFVQFSPVQFSALVYLDWTLLGIIFVLRSLYSQVSSVTSSVTPAAPIGSDV